MYPHIDQITKRGKIVIDYMDSVAPLPSPLIDATL
jgi:hypothetical protein